MFWSASSHTMRSSCTLCWYQTFWAIPMFIFINFLFLFKKKEHVKLLPSSFVREWLYVIIIFNTYRWHCITLSHVSITSPRSRALPRVPLATASSPTARAARGSTTTASNPPTRSASSSLRFYRLAEEWIDIFKNKSPMMCFISCKVSCFELCRCLRASDFLKIFLNVNL